MLISWEEVGVKQSIAVPNRVENTFGVVAPPKLARSWGATGFVILLQFCSLRGTVGVQQVGVCFCPSCRKCILSGGQTAYAAAEQARFGHQFCGRWERLQKSRPTR